MSFNANDDEPKPKDPHWSVPILTAAAIATVSTLGVELIRWGIDELKTIRKPAPKPEDKKPEVKAEEKKP